MPQLPDGCVHQVVGDAGLLEFADEPTRDAKLVHDLLQVLLGACRGEDSGAVGGKPSAIPNPIPDEAPVTIAVRPAKAVIEVSFGGKSWTSVRGRKPIPRGVGGVRPGLSVSVVTVRICLGSGCCRPLSRRRDCWRIAGMRGMCGIWRSSSSSSGWPAPSVVPAAASKTKRAIAKLKARERDRRKDWVEKTTTDLARQFDVIRVEALDVRAMTRSARGTVEQPGTGVAQKRGLNRGNQPKWLGSAGHTFAAQGCSAGSSRSRLRTRRNDAPRAGTSHPETARAKRSSSAKPALPGGATPT